MVGVRLATDQPRVRRGVRKPQHPFNIRVQPWQLQPMLLAPVLPGETMKNLMLMSRVVSDPIKNKLMGWFCEYYFFYVKHRDLSISSDMVSMHLDQSFTHAAGLSAVAAKYYHNSAATVNYAHECMKAVRDAYFRDDGEAEPTAIDTMFPAKIGFDGWWQSLREEGGVVAPFTDTTQLPGQETLTLGAPTTPDLYSGFANEYAQWQMMTAAGVTAVSFEDYLGSFGVRLPSGHAQDEERNRPELIRYVRDFTYPTNTVEPTTGVPSSAAVWSISERADKDRFFKEPGFVFGVQCIRPKVQLANATGSLSDYMLKAFDWLPALLQDQVYTSLKQFATGAGPAPVAFADDYWIDLRDLFLHGDQFRNHTDQVNSVALPDASGNVRYPIETDAAALFSDAVLKYVRSDGIVSLNIASPVYQDTST